MAVEFGSVGYGSGRSMSAEVAGGGTACGAELLAELNASLHEMSQPLTALLCMLEYGAGMECTEEVKGVIGGGLEQCGRLMDSVRTMQTRVLRTQVAETRGMLAEEWEGAERTRWR